jgi:ABC-type polysaccharide/polyol phosphate transport system ATPase subunit
MSRHAIRVHDLGKEYRIGQLRPRFRTLRDVLSRRDDPTTARRVASGRRERIWALRGVSFEVEPGEVVGIIGPNGAGKTTLLRILSRVTDPSTGQAEVRGHIGSLLEVGTGFHPELSGRENIYLNGAILGMRRRDIERRFDEIVDFAEVARFIDTPIKFYSSGMYLRLAFAVAAHLEPEILIVDEVLAVGDAAFQQKCLGKMSRVARGGRTVLFVSHNMDAIRRLCTRCLLLERGELSKDGSTADVVGTYMSRSRDRLQPGTWLDLSAIARDGTGEARFTRVRHTSDRDDLSGQPYPNGPLDFLLEIESDDERSVNSMAVAIYSATGTALINAELASVGEILQLQRGLNQVRLEIEALHLNPGTYTVGLWLGYAAGGTLDHAPSAFEIEIVQAETGNFGIAVEGLVPCSFRFVRAPVPTEAT